MHSLPLALLILAMLAAPAVPQKTCGGRIKLENIWKELAKRHDKDRDGRITKEEFTRGEKQFANHDRNRDGVITGDDYPEGRFWNSFGPGIARDADQDRDGSVSKEEWQAMMSKLDSNDDGEITMEELGTMMPATTTKKPKIVALTLDQNGDEKIGVVDFELLFVDLDRNSDGNLDPAELERNRPLRTRPKSPLPKVGKPAPDFELPRADDSTRTVRLSSFRGERPVALIFGSYT